MSALNITLPEFSEEDLQKPETIRKILEFLYQLNEQLRYMMNNLDEDNLSDSLAAKIDNPTEMANLATRVEDTENGLYSYRKQTAELISQKVGRDEVVSAINQSAEMIQILASKLQLEGYVTINGTFTIDESGYLRCTGGTIGGFGISSGSLTNGSFSLNASAQTINLSGITIRYNPSYGMDAITAASSLRIHSSGALMLLGGGGEGAGLVCDFNGIQLLNIGTTQSPPNLAMVNGRLCLCV